MDIAPTSTTLPSAPTVRSAAIESGDHRRVLVVDDDALVRRSLAMILERGEFLVDTASNGEHALKLVEAKSYAAIVSDLHMPQMDGLELMRRLRVDGRDVPVLLLSGNAHLDAACAAIERGVFRLLEKPIRRFELVAAVEEACALNEQSREKAAAMALLEQHKREEAARRDLGGTLDRAIRRSWMAYQPITRINGSLYGYEALLRSDEIELRSPLALLAAADSLGRSQELARHVRAQTADDFVRAPLGARLFVNVTGDDLFDDALLDPGSKFFALADRVVLEVTERHALNGRLGLAERLADLRSVGYRIAVDDLGAGYAGLSSITTLRPELVKIDMSIVRDIDRDHVARALVKMIATTCQDLHVTVVAEGIERAEERQVLIDLGVQLFQGYLMGKPSRLF